LPRADQESGTVAQRAGATKAKGTEPATPTPKTAKKTATPATSTPPAAPSRAPRSAAAAASRATTTDDRRPPAQHGTVRMANEGCLCDRCRTALSDYRRERATADW
jgi:hypothetical protein